MGKHEFLPFKMTVENGRLVPATPYDQERLLTWTKGSKVNVVFVRDGGRVMERKWWAVLNRAVKECKTPWKTSAEASEAIKLSIGVTNYTKTVGGEFLTYPKSLTELDDPELDDAVLLMIDIVYRVTGVDPAEWKRQVEHIRDEPTEHNSTSAATPGDDVDGIGTAAPSTSPDAPEISSQETAEEGDNPGTAAPSSEPNEREMVNSAGNNTDFLKTEMIKKLLQMAGDVSLSVGERLENLTAIHPGWVERMPGHPTLVSAVFNTSRKVIKGELTADKARQYLETLP